jgi:hypothetical protein
MDACNGSILALPTQAK